MSAEVFLSAFYVCLAIAGLFFLIDAYHLFRFGLVGPGAPFAILLFLGLGVVIVAHALVVVGNFDWSQSIGLPFGG